MRGRAFQPGRRRLLTGAGGLMLAGAAGIRAAHAAPSAAPNAERILFGRIHTLGTPNRTVEALAIADGRILAAGSRAAVVATRGPATMIHDLRGATIIPGFNDAHAHLEREGLKTLRLSLAGARSIADVLARIAAQAQATPPGAWILTMPVGEPPNYFGGPAQLAERRMPTRDELDGAAPRHPVCIGGPFGYWGEPPTYSALNSAGLRLAGIDRATVPRLAGVEIVRDPSGESTGVIVNRTRSPSVELDLLAALPRFTADERLEALRRSQRLYHARGVTSVYEGHGEAAQSIALYRRLWEGGELTMRAALVVSPSWGSLDEADRAMRDWLATAQGSGIGEPMLRIAGIFVGYGGDPAVAALARANLPDTGWSGQVEQANDPSAFEALCMLAGRHDLRLHTIVSDSLHEIVPILRRVAAHYPIGARRWVVEHIGRCRLEDLQAVQALGLSVTLIPANFLWKGGARFLDAAPDIAELVSPARQLIDLGVPVAAGTDNIPYDPFFTLWSMTTRQERTTGRAIGPAAGLSNEAALRLLTVAGAWLTFEERVKGPLIPGRYADLAVLTADPLAVAPDDLPAIGCRATLVGGRLVHGTL